MPIYSNKVINKYQVLFRYSVRLRLVTTVVMSLCMVGAVWVSHFSNLNKDQIFLDAVEISEGSAKS